VLKSLTELLTGRRPAQRSDAAEPVMAVAEELGRLAQEHAALRRVATLVSNGVPAHELFGVVTQEVGRLLGADVATMIRYQPDQTVMAVGSWAAAGKKVTVGQRWPLDGAGLAMLIARTGRPARIDHYDGVPGSTAAFIRDELGVRSSVGGPIVVDGGLWGALSVHSRDAEPLPADTESRLESFIELVATAISNIQARCDLASSRARIVAATEAERRRVVRDLHDGAQQRLVHTIVTLKLANRALQDEQAAAPSLVRAALDQAERATAELRELAHGILPSVLERGGLRAGVDALALRAPVPVQNGVSVGRLPGTVEATAYFVIAEALTNIAKHARARRAAVAANVEDHSLRLEILDDGVGGADADGSGLLGLRDRLAVLGGVLRLASPAGGGTLVTATIPLAGELGEAAA
jgi:signal transduction histidine kinase